MSRASDTGYAFGRDMVAALRLRIVHDVFEASSRALLLECGGDGPFETVLDLGCGPGPTTRLIDDVLAPATLVGLDLAADFLDLAARAVPRARFVRHDLRDLPWPGAPFDLVYARYVMAHLPEPEARLREWTAQLGPDGLLVLEEVERITARQAVFARYLDTVAGLLGGRGHDLYVGAMLAAAAGPAARLSRVVEVSPATAVVAAMFRLNLAAWGSRPDVPADADVAGLDRDLALLERSSATGEITWSQRQLVLDVSRM
jgi:SAM-dependent methyltransferase